LDKLLLDAKFRWRGEKLSYSIWTNLRSAIQGLEERRQKIYSYLMTTGALDYLVTAPTAASGIDAASARGIADRKQCTAAIDSECGGIKRDMSKEELDKQGECTAKVQFDNPVCVGVFRCTQLENSLPSGSDTKP
jgi:hypothetical protein